MFMINNLYLNKKFDLNSFYANEGVPLFYYLKDNEYYNACDLTKVDKNHLDGVKIDTFHIHPNSSDLIVLILIKEEQLNAVIYQYNEKLIELTERPQGYKDIWGWELLKVPGLTLLDVPNEICAKIDSMVPDEDTVKHPDGITDEVFNEIIA